MFIPNQTPKNPHESVLGPRMVKRWNSHFLKHQNQQVMRDNYELKLPQRIFLIFGIPLYPFSTVTCIHIPFLILLQWQALSAQTK